jgi:hypothetical protein
MAKTFEADYFSIETHFMLLLIYIVACKIISFSLTSLFLNLIFYYQIFKFVCSQVA